MPPRLSVAYIHSPHGRQLANWYAEMLGLKIEADFPGWTQFAANPETRFAVDHTGFPRSLVERQPIVLSFEVDDIHAAVNELAAKGVRFWPTREETIFDVGPKWVATFIDPDGNFVQLDSPKSSD